MCNMRLLGAFKEKLIDILVGTGLGFGLVVCLLPAGLLLGAVLWSSEHIFPGAAGWILGFSKLCFVLSSIYFLFNPLILIVGYCTASVAILLAGKKTKGVTDERRDAVRAEIAELYLESQSSVDTSWQSLSVAISRGGVTGDEVWDIAESEVGPILVPKIFENAFALGDAIEGPLDESWLTRKCTDNARAFRFVRRIPIFGFLWGRALTTAIRRSLKSAISDSSIPNE